MPEPNGRGGGRALLIGVGNDFAGDDAAGRLVARGLAGAAGFDVIVERSSDWRFGVPFRHSGSFRGAVDEVISGFSTAAVPPYITFYTNNVMTIGAR